MRARAFSRRTIPDGGIREALERHNLVEGSAGLNCGRKLAHVNQDTAQALAAVHREKSRLLVDFVHNLGAELGAQPDLTQVHRVLGVYQQVDLAGALPLSRILKVRRDAAQLSAFNLQ